MRGMVGREVFSRGPARSAHFWLGGIFMAIASCPAALIIVRHGNRVSTQALEWLLLGVAAVWLFWIRVVIAHTRLHRYISVSPADSCTDFVLDQAVQLAYTGLTLVGFAALGLLVATWSIVGAR